MSRLAGYSAVAKFGLLVKTFDHRITKLLEQAPEGGSQNLVGEFEFKMQRNEALIVCLWRKLPLAVERFERSFLLMHVEQTVFFMVFKVDTSNPHLPLAIRRVARKDCSFSSRTWECVYNGMKVE